MWYRLPSSDSWSKITFNATTKTASVAGLASGTTVCVKYIHNDASASQFVVSSAFIPDQVHAVLTLPLFKATVGSDSSYTSSSKVGEVQVDIPNFLLAGAQELSLSSSGAATTALSGSALASYTGNEGCDDDIRLNRLILRNNYTRDYAKLRLDSQAPQDEKVAKSDWVLYNNSSVEDLETQIVKLIEQIR